MVSTAEKVATIDEVVVIAEQARVDDKVVGMEQKLSAAAVVDAVELDVVPAAPSWVKPLAASHLDDLDDPVTSVAAASA